jgi:hypothetical protein
MSQLQVATLLLQQPAAGKCRAKPSTGRPGRRHGAEEYVTVASLSCNITVATACGREMLRYTSEVVLVVCHCCNSLRQGNAELLVNQALAGAVLSLRYMSQLQVAT